MTNDTDKINTFQGSRVFGYRESAHTKARLERVLPNPDLYEIEAGGGCAKITPPGIDGIDVRAIQESVDLRIYYIREDGVYIVRDGGWRV